MPDAGRPRDEALDAGILDAAAELLRSGGVAAVNFSKVAEMAGTTRPALYRRYPSPEHLALAALDHMSAGSIPQPTGDPLADLEAELKHFRDGVESSHSVALVGSMLMPDVDENFAERYRETLVGPRRSRLRAILDDARKRGEISAPPGDLAVAVTMCTGSLYASALAGVPTPNDWPKRVARLVWQSVGGA